MPLGMCALGMQMLITEPKSFCDDKQKIALIE